ncbi:hypothetical protein MMC10_003089 [Thelotrema lepadinum]|nr:hypothetical protein [Thelotrema lepadinum]
MEEVRLLSGANGGRSGLFDRDTFAPPSPTQPFHIKHEINISGLRSSPHPVDIARGEDIITAGRSSISREGISANEPEDLPAQKTSNDDRIQTTSHSGQGAIDDYHAKSSADYTLPLPLKLEGNGNVPITFDALSIRTNELPGDDGSLLDAGTSLVGSDGPRIQGFAKFEFDDGQFYMNTYAVELGRDIRAARKALQQDLEADQSQERQQAIHNRHKSNSSVDAANGTQRHRIDERKRTASSVMSESGGILNYNAYDSESLKKSKSWRSKSESSASRQASFRTPAVYSKPRRDEQISYETPAKHSTYGAQPVNPSALMPSPDECPLIPIHPPVAIDGTNVGHRGISRRHVRIAYNFEKRLFEMHVRGRNGAFVDEQFHGPDEVAELRSGSFIQIGGVGIKFILPNVAVGETGAESTQVSEAHSAMSFDFEDGRGESIAMADTSESDSSDVDRGRQSTSRSHSLRGSEERTSLDDSSGSGNSDGDENDILDRGAKRKARKEVSSSKKTAQKPRKTSKQVPSSKTNIKSKLKVDTKASANGKGFEVTRDQMRQELNEEAVRALNLDIPISMIPPRRKGPGRPPKNGFMSKREEASLKKQAREAAKAQVGNEGDAGLEAIKSPIEAPGLVKRKYTKRKKADGQPDEIDIHESIEGPESLDLSQTASPSQPKPPKEKKPKPPKSPSPLIDEASLTAEQLAKPQQSYVVLIHEALTNSPSGQMSLPQIYKAIERRYPYFKFKVQTVGWQSSIRHNLSQHAAFRKVEREGKGWMWGLVPEVSIEKERRPRRPTPPLPQNNYYPPTSGVFHPPYPYQGMSEQQANATSMSQSQFMYPPLPGNGFKNPTVVKGLNGLPLPISQVNSNSTYQSPYTPAPPTGNAQDDPQVFENMKSESLMPPQFPSGTSNTTTSIGQDARESEIRRSYTSQKPLSSRPVTTNSRPPQEPANKTSTPVALQQFSENTMNAVNRFKSIMIESMSNIAHAEEIVTHAINRTLDNQPSESQQKEYPEEQAIMDALRNMLNQIRETEQQREQWQKQQDSTTSVAPRSEPIHHDSNLDRKSPSREHKSSENSGKLVHPTEQRSSELDSSAAVSQPATNTSEVSPTALLVSPNSTLHPSQPVPKVSPAAEGCDEALPRPSSQPLPKAEKDELLSLLGKLDQPRPLNGASPPATDEATIVKVEPDALPNEFTPEINRGVKRKLDGEDHPESLSKDTVESPATSSTMGGMASIENSRAKRVAV